MPRPASVRRPGDAVTYPAPPGPAPGPDPSKEAFLKMVSSQAYPAIHVHREAGLAHQLLVACESLPA